MTTTLTVEEIEELTRDTWTALLADEGALCPSGEVTGADGGVLATVEISGAWNGLTTLSCSERAARQAASAMFELADAELSPAEVSDAIGELVNVVGGNIKSLLPGPTELSLPSFHEQDDYGLPEGLSLALRVQFSWFSEPVVVSVFEAAD